MIAPTHMAFAVACGMLGGASPSVLGLLAGGSLLPDIDHPQSTIGRILSPLSIPLNSRFGHRRTIHSFLLWGAIALAGIFWRPLLWVGLGALSHIYLDLWNIAGVQAMMPVSERVFVLFSRKYRIPSGSKNELVLMVVLGAVAWSGGYVSSMGGIRALFGTLTGSYTMAYNRYLEADTHICHFHGTLRHRDGRTEKGKWLVIGKEGEQMGVAIWNEENQKILHVPEQAEFLKVRLQVSEKSWQTLALNGWATAKKAVFFYDGGKWKYGGKGDVVFGFVIGKELSLDMGEWKK